MQDHVTYLAAFMEGVIAFLTPCTLPMTPLYLTYMTGVSAADVSAGQVKVARWRVLMAALAFVAGFATVFVSLGALADIARPVLKGQYFQIISGALIILMGLNFLGAFQIALFNREKRMQSSRAAGVGGAYVMGVAFAAGWSPCLGPILSATLAMAANQQTMGEGAALLAVFSLGLGLPFLLAALAVDAFLGFVARFRPYLGVVEKVSGVLLILIGAAFIYGGLDFAGGWTRAFLPETPPQ